MSNMKRFSNKITDTLMNELKVPIKTSFSWISGPKKGVSFKTFSCIGKQEKLIGELKFSVNDCRYGISITEDEFKSLISRYIMSFKLDFLFDFVDEALS